MARMRGRLRAMRRLRAILCRPMRPSCASTTSATSSRAATRLIARWLTPCGRACVNAIEIVAPAEAQAEFERVLDEARRTRPRVLRFYDVKDLAWDAAVDVGPDTAPFEIDSLTEMVKTALGPGAAEIQPRNRVLVVRAEPAVHAATLRFLADLRAPQAPSTP